jgi:hypothetical protein
MAVQTRQQVLGERLHALLAGVDHDVGDFAVQRIAHGVQLFQLFLRIGRRKQRPVAVVAHALPEMSRARVQVDHRAVAQPCARFSSASTAPPPVASTTPSSAHSSPIACASRARNPASPSISKITGMRTPQRRSISSSES